MKALKYALCALLMIMLAGTAFAQAVGTVSQVISTPATNGQTTLYNISVLTFVPSTASAASPVAQWYKDCNNDQSCVNQKAQAYYATIKTSPLVLSSYRTRP